MAEHFDVPFLRKCVRKHCAVVPEDEIVLTPIPTGKFNTSFYVGCGDREMVLRIAPSPSQSFLFYEKSMMLQEPSIHRLLLEHTTVPVAPILALDTEHDIVDRNFLLMERLPGLPLSDAGMVDAGRAFRQTGESLAQAHALTAEHFGYLGEHHPMPPQETWPDAFLMMWHKMVDDIVGVGHYDGHLESRLKRLVDTHRSLFEHCRTSRLLHMDVWGQNLLVDESGNLTGIVDWDRALWGDPEIEFAVLDYCGVSDEAFWEGYGRPRPASDDARIRNVFYLLYEIQKYIVIRQGRQHNAAGARAYKHQVLRIIERVFG